MLIDFAKAGGLVPAIAQDSETGDVLMMAYMNQDAFDETVRTRRAVYYSRSRKAIWHKGATSGLTQKIAEMRIDDDQDAVWLRVDVAGSGASCHVGYRSCFYRSIPLGDVAKAIDNLKYEESEKTFDPKAVYGDAPNPTQL